MCSFRPILPSTALHRPHSAQVESHVNELELGFYFFQPAHPELAKPQNILDPAVGWRGYRLAFSVVKFALLGLKLGGHGNRMRVTLGVPGLGQYLALAPQRNHPFGMRLGLRQLGQHLGPQLNRCAP